MRRTQRRRGGRRRAPPGKQSPWTGELYGFNIHAGVLIDREHAPSLEAAANALVDAFVDMKIEHASVDAGIVHESLRQGLTGDAFALDDEYTRRFAEVIERWKPEVRPDLPSDLAAYVLSRVFARSW